MERLNTSVALAHGVGRTQDKKEEYIAPLRSASGGELWKEVVCLSFSKLAWFGLF
jgi:hypothetical protein